MATKLSNYHINQILEKAKKYNTPAVYVLLAHISTEVNAKKSDLVESKDKLKRKFFLIQTSNKQSKNLNKDNIEQYELNALVNILTKYISVDIRTIKSALIELMELNILQYNPELLAWELINMDKMVFTKTDLPDEEQVAAKGYTDIREILLSDTFLFAKPYQKKLWLYLCMLNSSKAGKVFANYNGCDFEINILRKKTWKNILGTKSVYVAKYRIQKFIKANSNIIEEIYDEYDNRKHGFKFRFNIKGINVKPNEDQLLELLNSSEIKTIQDKLNSYNQYYEDNYGKTITLTKDKIYKLARAIKNIANEKIKENIVEAILKKFAAIQIFESRESIKSLTAYTVAVARDHLNAYNNLMAARNQIRAC